MLEIPSPKDPILMLIHLDGSYKLKKKYGTQRNFAILLPFTTGTVKDVKRYIATEFFEDNYKMKQISILVGVFLIRSNESLDIIQRLNTKPFQILVNDIIEKTSTRPRKEKVEQNDLEIEERDAGVMALSANFSNTIAKENASTSNRASKDVRKNKACTNSAINENDDDAYESDEVDNRTENRKRKRVECSEDIQPQASPLPHSSNTHKKKHKESINDPDSSFINLSKNSNSNGIQQPLVENAEVADEVDLGSDFSDAEKSINKLHNGQNLISSLPDKLPNNSSNGNKSRMSKAQKRKERLKRAIAKNILVGKSSSDNDKYIQNIEVVRSETINSSPSLLNNNGHSSSENFSPNSVSAPGNCEAFLKEHFCGPSSVSESQCSDNHADKVVIKDKFFYENLQRIYNVDNLRVGMTIAFRFLELDKDRSPALSDFKEGKVTGIKGQMISFDYLKGDPRNVENDSSIEIDGYIDEDDITKSTELHFGRFIGLSLLEDTSS